MPAPAVVSTRKMDVTDVVTKNTVPFSIEIDVIKIFHGSQ